MQKTIKYSVISILCVVFLSAFTGCDEIKDTINAEGKNPEKYDFGDATKALLNNKEEIGEAYSVYCDPETEPMVKDIAIKLIQKYIPILPDGGICSMVDPRFISSVENK